MALRRRGFGHRVGVCVDTCHILAAGYDITTAEGTKAVLEEMDHVIGLKKRVKVWHLNDSKKPCGSRGWIRHEHIGRGFVGVEAFGVICAADTRMKGVPKIMETPKEAAPDGRDWDVVNLRVAQPGWPRERKCRCRSSLKEKIAKKNPKTRNRNSRKGEAAVKRAGKAATAKTEAWQGGQKRAMIEACAARGTFPLRAQVGRV